MSRIYNYDILKKGVLSWLNELKVHDSDYQYRFSKNSSGSIFTSCFALFILDLFNETKNFTEMDRNGWVEHIQQFQNKKQGYFEPKKYYHHDRERNCYQLTCFCLSALDILNAKPLYPLSFVYKKWNNPQDIRKYLKSIGSDIGRGGSGNKAMFVAIFLTYEYLNTRNSTILNNIDSWFDFHNKYQNPRTGVWGTQFEDNYYRSIQNGFHQIIIYDYWNREINFLDKLLSRLQYLQNKDGSFSPIPGGESCFDSDAINLLSIISNRYSNLPNKVFLERSMKNMLANKNTDGGFAESKTFPKNVLETLDIIPQVLTYNLDLLYIRMKAIGSGLFNNNIYNNTGWVKERRCVYESNLWDTWFRCFGISQLDMLLFPERDCRYNFHKFIGIGFANIRKKEFKK